MIAHDDQCGCTENAGGFGSRNIRSDVPRRPEQIIQRAVFDRLRLRAAPGVFAFHVPNGGYRKPIEAAIMKGLGVKAGVPDVVAIAEGRCYALELKAEDGRATPKQLESIAAMQAAGAYCCIAEGFGPGARRAGELGHPEGPHAMKRAPTFRQADIVRALKAAATAGLHVAGYKMDCRDRAESRL